MRKGKKANASSAHLARFLLRFEALLSPVFGFADGPHMWFLLPYYGDTSAHTYKQLKGVLL